MEDTTVSVDDGVAFFDELEVTEGTRITQTFTYSSRNLNQRFILPNAGIDTDTIIVQLNLLIRLQSR